jgi:hypothetical protein
LLMPTCVIRNDDVVSLTASSNRVQIALGS